MIGFCLLCNTVSPKDEKNSDAELGNHTEEVKHLGRSKWSDSLDDDGDEKTELLKGKANVLSGLLGTYGKEGKSVHWSDQVRSIFLLATATTIFFYCFYCLWKEYVVHMCIYLYRRFVSFLLSFFT